MPFGPRNEFAERSGGCAGGRGGVGGGDDGARRMEERCESMVPWFYERISILGRRREEEKKSHLSRARGWRRREARAIPSGGAVGYEGGGRSRAASTKRLGRLLHRRNPSNNVSKPMNLMMEGSIQNSASQAAEEDSYPQALPVWMAVASTDLKIQNI